MKVLTKTEINEFYRGIRDRRVTPLTPPRLPICIIFDYSGSMERYKFQADSILRNMCNYAKEVGRREITLCIIVIHNGLAHVSYLGGIREFNCDEFIKSMPAPYGKTPLIESFDIAETILTEIKNNCHISRQACTIPFFFLISDFISTEDIEAYKYVLKNITEDFANNRKIVIECVLCNHENGINMGGYRIPLETYDTKAIQSVMNAFKTASSSAVNLSGNQVNSVNPRAMDYIEYSYYLSGLLIDNMAYMYNRLSKER